MLVLYTKTPARPTDTQLLDQFYILYDYLGHWPTIRELQDDETFTNHSCRAICDRFGGLQAVIDATKFYRGMLSIDERAALESERIQILGQLQKCYGHMEYWQPRTAFTNDRRIAKLKAFSRCCGGLDAALRELGLPVCFPSRDDLIAALQYSQAVLGEAPKLVDAEAKLCVYPYSAYLNEFELWNFALQAAGISVNLDQPNRRATIAKQRYSFYRHPNQICAPSGSKVICALPS